MIYWSPMLCDETEMRIIKELLLDMWIRESEENEERVSRDS